MVFRVDGGSGVGYAPDNDSHPAGRIALYGVAGELIREMHVRQGRAEWDGLDSRGRSVAPGVYWLRPSARP